MHKLRILICTDAWHPQVNGVVRTLSTTIDILRKQGHLVEILQPGCFHSFAVPFYPEIRLSFAFVKKVSKVVREFQPDTIHISTEGPIGQAARELCRRRGWRFTTSYHTKFPEYLKQLVKIPLRASYGYMRRFHSLASAMMVATPSLEKELLSRNFKTPIVRWSRGVDLTLFQPRAKESGWNRPVLLYAGRVSKEKNIEAFLQLRVPGTKVVVGDGPIRSKLESAYPDTKFLGYRTGKALADVYANADCFVFPSRTDTFGLVVIEALACGVPVAAYPVMGPVDIITEKGTGALSEDLDTAVRRALIEGDPEACIRHAQKFTWEQSSIQFLNNLRNRFTGLSLQNY
jgi:glycosyltransferase involved in cell wall biosynthesis